MAQKLVSPGVFTNENDLSFLASGVGQIGAAVIGPTERGPAFIPQAITSYAKFNALYGNQTQKSYVPYAVKDYLENGGIVTVTRVMTSEPWTEANAYLLNVTQLTGSYASGSATITSTASAYYVTGSDATIYTITPGASNALVSGTSYTVATGSDYSAAAGNLVSLLNTYSAFGISASNASAVLNMTASSFGTEGNLIAFQSGSTRTTLSGGSYRTTGSAKTVGYLVPKGTITNNTGSDDLSLITGSGATNNSILANNFIITSSLGTASVSFASSSNKNIKMMFGTDPFMSSNNGLANRYYLYRFFEEAANTYSTQYSASISKVALTFSINRSYNHGVTPYVTSQLISGQVTDLFRIHRRSDGKESNFDVKIIIEDIKKPGTVGGTDFGTFTLTVRRVGSFFDSADTDDKPEVLESFSNLDLNPKSPNFILRRIGDRRPSIETSTGNILYSGNYKNLSDYITVEAIADFETIPNNLFPAGFRAVKAPINSSNIPAVPYVTLQGSSTAYSKRVPFGWNFYSTDALQYLWSLEDNGSAISIGSDFNLDNMFSHASSSGALGTDGASFTPRTSLSSSVAPVEMLKFAVPFQNGHDGMPYNRKKNVGTDISATNVFGFDCSTSTASGSVAYRTAILTLSNADEYDINLLAVPGILSSLHSSITDYAMTMCQDRSDVFYVMDSAQLTDSVVQAVNNVSTYDNNYSATYYPWVKILDTDNNIYVWAPPSVVTIGAIAQNDRLGYEWMAPAGSLRGGLANVYETYRKLYQSDCETLYSGRVNPIRTFVGDGTKIWGQKTLQAKASALDRINVRRLLINLKKYIASTTRYLVFENNTTATRNRFLSIVEPYMDSIKQRQGLYAFKVVCDETNNTPEVIDRNILYGQIFLQPAKSSEFIVVDFNITPTGASFSA